MYEILGGQRLMIWNTWGGRLLIRLEYHGAELGAWRRFAVVFWVD